MSDLPWYGWLFFGLIIAILIATNWSLISALRGRTKKKSENVTVTAIKRMGQTVRQPFKKEDDLLAELSKRAAELRSAADTSKESSDR